MKRFRCFDHHAYYNRYMLFAAFVSLSGARVEIRCADEPLDVAIARQTHADFSAPRRMKLAALVGEDLRITAASG